MCIFFSEMFVVLGHKNVVENLIFNEYYNM